MCESYNLLILDQFQGYYKNESAKLAEFKERANQLDKHQLLIQNAKHELYAQ